MLGVPYPKIFWRDSLFLFFFFLQLVLSVLTDRPDRHLDAGHAALQKHVFHPQSSVEPAMHFYLFFYLPTKAGGGGAVLPG